MANFFANQAFDINNIDLNWYERNLFDLEFLNNVNIVFNGINYRDVYVADGFDGSDDLDLILGGPRITVNSDLEVTGGTVTGILETQSGSGAILWGIEGISVSALAIFNAALTASNNDEIRLAKMALSGNDTFDLSPFGDVMNGFGGNDTMLGNGGNDFLEGGPGNDIIRGGTGYDLLRGNGGDDRIFGDSGNDLLLGFAGNDRLFGGTHSDNLKGGGSSDILNGGTGNDKLFGNGGSDDLDGGNDNDLLVGGAGIDNLNGGRGNDRLKGKGGADILEFEVGGDKDRIKGFQDGLDRIDLTDFGFANVAAVKAFGNEVSGNSVFNFGGGDVLTIENTLLSQISGADLIL